MSNKSYNHKIFISGGVLEIYRYDKVIPCGYKDSKRLGDRGRKSSATEEDKQINRSKVTNRAKNDLMRLINSNFVKGSSRFITLTFKDNVTDIKTANYEFVKFVKRFNYYLGYKTEYSVVIEFQERGAIHYHTIFYNIPGKLNLPECSEIWGQGSFNCKRIDKISNVGAYMVKYMTKNASDERLEGNKMYFNSRGLKKPKEITEPHIVKALVESLRFDSPVFVNEYEINYNSSVQNYCRYSQYIID